MTLLTRALFGVMGEAFCPVDYRPKLNLAAIMARRGSTKAVD